MDSSTLVPPEVIDSARLASLRRTGLLDSPPEKAFDDLTRLVSRLLNAPVSLVSLVDVDRQFFKSVCGLPEPWASDRETPLSHSFCKHVVATNEPLVVENAREHPVVRTNLAIRDLGVIAYLGVPLVTPDGSVIGSLCAVDGDVRRWSADHVSTLSVLAEAVMNEIAVRLHVDQIKASAAELLASHEALERYASELKVANVTKDKFFTIIAHDLRGPLQALLGYSEALVDETRADPGVHAADLSVRLLGASRNMVQLVENLLDWARMQNGALQSEPRPVDLSSLIRSAIATVGQQANRKGVLVEADADEAFEVFADPHMAASVLQNLLTNAIKFTPAGGCVRVTVGGRGECVEVAVEDNGIGMDHQTVNSLFGPDQACSRRGTHGEKGTGLGMKLCREFVEMNGGSIRVASTQGHGTRVAFTLPTEDARLSKRVA